MDKRIRRNEICVIGMPRCDFVFSSTRSCFIAYGFEESPLEKTILRNILEGKGIQCIEAGGRLAPAQNAFCAKICSKIVTSQFCAVLLNNDERSGSEVPNANVNMEYGLMLGFNKYIVPFQRASQELPFNVAGLDTIKYTNSDFGRLAASAIDQAIKDTQQESIASPPIDQILDGFLLKQGALVTNVDKDGAREIFQLGSPLGFNLLNDFAGMSYMFFGNFTTLRPEIVAWRIHKLAEILTKRRSSFAQRLQFGMSDEKAFRLAEHLIEHIAIWVLVTSDDEKRIVRDALNPLQYTVSLWSAQDVVAELESNP